MDLIEQLWDSIADTTAELPIPQWHRDLLDQRLAAADEHPEQTIPWSDVRSSIRSKD